MKGVTVKVNINKNLAKQLVDDKARLFTHQTMYRLMFDFVPFVTGTLAESVKITSESVHFIQPYAARQNGGDGFNFSHEKHPLATSHWDQAMMASRGEKFHNTLENYLKRRAQNGR